MSENFEKSAIESKVPPFTADQENLFEHFWPKARFIAKFHFSFYKAKGQQFDWDEFISLAGEALVLATRKYTPGNGSFSGLYRKILRDTVTNSIRAQFRKCRRSRWGCQEIPLSVHFKPEEEISQSDFVVDEKTPPPHHLIDIRDELEFIKTVQVAKSPEISIRNWKIAESYLANEENRSKIPAQVGVGMTRVQQITTSTIAIVRQSPEVAALTVP